MRRLVILAAILLFFGAGCAHYTVMAQGMPDERAVREVAPVRATAIEFAFQQPGWESDAEWNDHVRAWNEAYLAGLAKAGRGLGARQPQVLPPGTPASDGLVIAATVRDIQRSFMTGDKIVADVVVFEAATRRTTLRATLEVSSNRLAGSEGYTFGGRIKFACLNLADAIVDALRAGRFDP
jgi:hypothetical protein